MRNKTIFLYFISPKNVGFAFWAAAISAQRYPKVLEFIST